MITAAGAEGISLQNVRYVHITEPYWHPVRIEQVIGRARRICSHQNLPKEDQRVEVYLYLMSFTEKQLEEEASIELKTKDTSKLIVGKPLTSDQALYEISSIKEDINKQILKAIKEASIDCAIQTRTKNSENIQCFAFSGDIGPNKFSYQPSIEGGDDDDITNINQRKVVHETRYIRYKNKQYVWNKNTNELYDFESFEATKNQENANPLVVGKLFVNGTKKRIQLFK